MNRVVVFIFLLFSFHQVSHADCYMYRTARCGDISFNEKVTADQVIQKALTTKVLAPENTICWDMRGCFSINLAQTPLGTWIELWPFRNGESEWFFRFPTMYNGHNFCPARLVDGENLIPMSAESDPKAKHCDQVIQSIVSQEERFDRLKEFSKNLILLVNEAKSVVDQTSEVDVIEDNLFGTKQDTLFSLQQTLRPLEHISSK